MEALKCHCALSDNRYSAGDLCAQFISGGGRAGAGGIIIDQSATTDTYIKTEKFYNDRVFIISKAKLGILSLTVAPDFRNRVRLLFTSFPLQAQWFCLAEILSPSFLSKLWLKPYKVISPLP